MEAGTILTSSFPTPTVRDVAGEWLINQIVKKIGNALYSSSQSQVGLSSIHSMKTRTMMQLTWSIGLLTSHTNSREMCILGRVRAIVWSMQMEETCFHLNTAILNSSRSDQSWNVTANTIVWIAHIMRVRVASLASEGRSLRQAVIVILIRAVVWWHHRQPHNCQACKGVRAAR